MTWIDVAANAQHNLAIVAVFGIIVWGIVRWNRP